MGSLLALILVVIVVYIPIYRFHLYHKVFDGYLIKKPRRPPMFDMYKTKYQHFNSIKLMEKMAFSFILVFLQDMPDF